MLQVGPAEVAACQGRRFQRLFTADDRFPQIRIEDVGGGSGDWQAGTEAFWQETERLRDFFKFEFFYAPREEFRRAINEELARFSPELADRPQIVAINKVDLGEVREAVPETRRRLEEAGAQQVLAISAVTGEGVDELLEALWSALSRAGRDHSR